MSTGQREQRLDDAKALIENFKHILELHRQEFPPASRPLAPPPVEPNRPQIYAHYEGQALFPSGQCNRDGLDHGR